MYLFKPSDGGLPLKILLSILNSTQSGITVSTAPSPILIDYTP